MFIALPQSTSNLARRGPDGTAFGRRTCAGAAQVGASGLRHKRRWLNDGIV
jgi:hypothetical protein